MKLSDKQKTILKRWSKKNTRRETQSFINEVEALPDEEGLLLFKEIERLNEAMTIEDNYVAKINEREYRHTTGFSSEEVAFDRDGKEYMMSKRVIGISNGRPKTVNLYRKDRLPEDDHDRPMTIINQYAPESKPCSGELKYSPEDIYINKCRQRLLREVLRIVWPMLTKTQKETLKLKLKFIDAHCSEECKYNDTKDKFKSNECEHFGKARECRPDIKHGKSGKYNLGRYWYNKEIDVILGKANKTTSKLLERLPVQMSSKYVLHQEDRSFLFNYVD